MALVSFESVASCPTEHQSDPVGHGILLWFALPIVLEEIDKEADTLMDAASPFRGAQTWSWDSLLELSLDSQQVYAMKNAPVLWLVLSTIAINKERRTVMEIKEDGRDPWQVWISGTLPRLKLKSWVGDGHCTLHVTLFAEQICCSPPSGHKRHSLLVQRQPLYLSAPFPPWNFGRILHSQQKTPRTWRFCP